MESPNIINSLDSHNKVNKKKLGIIVVALIIVGLVAASLIVVKNNKMKAFSLGDERKIYSLLRVVDEESATIEAVKKVTPSVVSIVISKDLSKYYDLRNSSPFDDFFFGGLPSSPAPQGNNEGNGKQTVGGGTGFIISKDGLILTNKHVVSDEEAEYTVITNDGTKYSAKVLAVDPFNDIAMVKIEAKNLSVIELGDSDSIQLGQTVIAIGNSLGEYRNTVTKGVISGKERKVEAGDNMGMSEVLEEAIQTDAAINPGNSGGPLINLAGQVIGINTAINLQGQLIGFAIPINQAKKSIDSVKKNGKIVRPFLGIRYVLIDKQIAKENNLDTEYGALVIRGKNPTDLAVMPGSPADKAELAENDIILEVNGQKIDAEHDLAKEISKYQPNDEVKLRVRHKGKDKEIKVKLGEYKK